MDGTTADGPSPRVSTTFGSSQARDGSRARWCSCDETARWDSHEIEQLRRTPVGASPARDRRGPGIGHRDHEQPERVVERHVDLVARPDPDGIGRRHDQGREHRPDHARERDLSEPDRGPGGLGRRAVRQLHRPHAHRGHEPDHRGRRHAPVRELRNGHHPRDLHRRQPHQQRHARPEHGGQRRRRGPHVHRRRERHVLGHRGHDRHSHAHAQQGHELGEHAGPVAERLHPAGHHDRRHAVGVADAHERHAQDLGNVRGHAPHVHERHLHHPADGRILAQQPQLHGRGPGRRAHPQRPPAGHAGNDERRHDRGPRDGARGRGCRHDRRWHDEPHRAPPDDERHLLHAERRDAQRGDRDLLEREHGRVRPELDVEQLHHERWHDRAPPGQHGEQFEGRLPGRRLDLLDHRRDASDRKRGVRGGLQLPDRGADAGPGRGQHDQRQDRDDLRRLPRQPGADVTIQNGSTLNQNAFPLTAANVTIGTGSTLNLNGTKLTTGGTSFTNNGTLTGTTAGSQLIFLNAAAAQSYSGTGTVSSPLQTITFDTPSGVTLGSGISSIPTLNVNLSRGTVTNSNKLTLGTGAALAVQTVTGKSGLLTAGGSYDVAPTFNLGTGAYTVSYQPEGGARTTGAEIPATRSVQNLTINNANGVTLAGGDLTVNGTLTLTAGNVTTGVNTLALSATGTVSRTSGFIVGNLKKNVATGANVARTFEIGTGNDFAPVNLTFASVTGAGDLTATTVAGDHPSIASSGLNASHSVNRYWTLTNAGIAFTTYSPTFNFVATDVDAGSATASFVVRKFNTPTWTTTTTGTRTATSTQATGIASFSDFAVAEAAGNHSIVASAGANGSISPSGTVAVADRSEQTSELQSRF